ncbi:hypothetical protein Agub_g14875, partial [Astrephomene gubernaculifera]
LGGGIAAAQMLRELGAGLLPYGERELQAIVRDVRRPGSSRSRSSSGSALLPADADPLDPWNLPYALQGLAQGRAASRYDSSWGAAYADYFAPPGLLKGSDALCRTLFGLALVGPMPLAAGEARGWTLAEDQAGSAAGGAEAVEDVAAAAGAAADEGARNDGGGGDSNGHGDGTAAGTDVLMKAQVVCCRTGRKLGLIYFHLHGRLGEFPFTTLLRHGPMGHTWHGADGGMRPAGDADPAADGEDASMPVVVVRLPYRRDPQSACGGPESPYFLKAWLHELGHALHHVASAAACGVLSASDLLPPQPPEASCESTSASSGRIPSSAATAGLGNPTSNATRNMDHNTASATTSASSSTTGTTSASTSTSTSTRTTSNSGLLALLSGVSCALDLRELPSHLLEHVLREAGGVRLLARHGRLDCPLPQRDCARLVAQLSTCFTSTVGELQSLVAAALADQIMHGPQPAPDQQDEPRQASNPQPQPQSPSQQQLQQQGHPQQCHQQGSTDGAAGVPKTTGAPPAETSNAAAGGATAAAATAAATAAPAAGEAPGRAEMRMALRAHLEAHAATCSLTVHHHRAQLQEHHHNYHHQQQRHEQQEHHQQQQLEQQNRQRADGLTSPEQPRQPSPPPPPPPPPPLVVPGNDALHHLEALAVVGGAQYVYVASRLFAAAAWRAYRLQDQLLFTSSPMRGQEGIGTPSILDHYKWGSESSRGFAVGMGVQGSKGEEEECSGEGEGSVKNGGWLLRQRLLEA